MYTRKGKGREQHMMKMLEMMPIGEEREPLQLC
jgi:hypothetical protein